MTLVSVVIPTYNRCQLVQLAIDSVLAQTYTDYELIVVDDGSTDGTGEALASRYGDRIRYVWQENQGESSARNRGISIARGKYIAFLDSDDLWCPEKLARQMALLERSPAVGLVFCQAQKIDEVGKRLPGPPIGADSSQLEPTFENLCLHNFVAAGGSTAVMRKAVLEEVGGFDETIHFAEDWDLWLRTVLVTDIAGIPEPLASVRLHRGGQWWFPNPETVGRVLKDHLRLLDRAFAAWSNNTGTAQALRARAIAQEHAKAAWAYYAFGNIEGARQQLELALALDPQTWKDTNVVSASIVSTAWMLSQMHPEKPTVVRRYVDTVLGCLPEPLSVLSQQRRRLIARAEMEVGYGCYASGDRRRARRHILRGMWADPGWFRNRGTVAVLLDLCFGSTLVHAIRRLQSLGRSNA